MKNKTVKKVVAVALSAAVCLSCAGFAVAHSDNPSITPKQKQATEQTKSVQINFSAKSRIPIAQLQSKQTSK